MKRRVNRSLGALCCALLSGCDGVQSALDPAGPQAARIERLWWFLLTVSTIVFVLVLLATLYAFLHRQRSLVPLEADTRRERRLHTAIIVATGATVATLFAFLVVNFTTERALASLPGGPPLTIEVTGTQWWWKVRYVDSVASRTLITANEIHIPVGTPVKFELLSNDVIHSLWVPRLHGKRDLVPGHRAVTWLRADSAGVFRGQCAEFCGHQHAKMALTVVAEPRAQFDAWYEQQLQPAHEPTTDEERRGRDVFTSATCGMCHAIRGTEAGASVGPDLTHLASRGTIAAATLPNTRGHLGGWIVDPQSIKPGAKMPANSLRPEDLQALLSYLESLR
jgi:cytochrome c oxidase subunit II